MSELALIMPYKELTEKAVIVTEELKLDVKIETALLNQAVAVAKKLDQEGVKVIISRGGTALILKKLNVNAKIIELNITEFDIISALLTAKKFDNNIGFVGFNNMFTKIEKLAKLLEIQLFKKIIVDEEQTPQLLDEISGKVDVVIGGVITTRWAKSKNINNVLIETTENSIKQTIKEAINVIDIITIEKEKRTEIQTIMNLVKEGIIAINRKGEVTYINNLASDIYDVDISSVLGKNIMNISSDIELMRILKTEKQEADQICNINNKVYNINRVPIKIENKVIGAIKLIHDISEIEKIEEKARRKTYAKGYYASYEFKDIIGESLIIQKAIDRAKRFSKVNSNLIISGETGSGKEVFAQSIHNFSNRNNNPFVAINCAALPEKLLESELFGYEGGAFTGAKKEGKKGLFELAHKGTIFLDEISEMALNIQARLLRVLQENKVRRIGGDKLIPVDLRIIAATNKNLEELISNNLFREDLYFRLNVLNLKLPPLRSRSDDIKSYINYFVDEFSRTNNFDKVSFTKEALKALKQYSWPGNIRELKNIVERMLVLVNDEIITISEVEELLSLKNISESYGADKESIYNQADILLENNNLNEIVDNLEKYIIKQILSKNGGNKSEAAKQLGIDRTTLWRKLK